MRLGFDAKRAFTNVTGLGNYSRYVIGILTRRYPEHDYLLYTPRTSGAPPPAAGPARMRVRTPPRPFTGGLAGAAWRTWALGLVAARDRLDVYHGLSQELPETIAGRGMRTVVTAHDLIYLRFPELYPALDRRLYAWKYGRSCARADHVVAVSHQTRRDVIDYFGVAESKVSVVYQSCDERFKHRVPPETVAAVRRRYGLPTEYLLSVGTIEQRKNALVILRALTQLERAPILLLVGRPTAYLRTLTDFARRRGLQERVRVLHSVGADDLPAVYQGANIFLYPSLFEGFGLPILEALWSDVPVITSTGSCFAEVGGPAAHYVPPDQPDALAEAIRAVLDDSDRRDRMITAGRAHATSFDDDRIAAALLDIYTGASP